MTTEAATPEPTPYRVYLTSGESILVSARSHAEAAAKWRPEPGEDRRVVQTESLCDGTRREEWP